MTRSTFAMIIQSDISSPNGSASEFIPSCLNYIFIIVELLKQFWLWANDFIINQLPSCYTTVSTIYALSYTSLILKTASRVLVTWFISDYLSSLKIGENVNSELCNNKYEGKSSNLSSNPKPFSSTVSCCILNR